MKKLLLFIVFSVFCVSSASADKLYLKNGKVLEGKLRGKSEKRYLFALDTGDEGGVPLSYFPEDVEKIELGKDTVEAQIPYLKELEDKKINVSDDESKVVTISLYGESPDGTIKSLFTQAELRKALTKEEAEYYEKYNYTLMKYADKFQVIQSVLTNLPTATRDEFSSAKGAMDELYFELNNIPVPPAFKKSHVAYLTSVKANYLAFEAFEGGVLEEASRQLKIADESKEKAVAELRAVILQKQAEAKAAEEGKAAPEAAPAAAPAAPATAPAS